MQCRNRGATVQLTLSGGITMSLPGKAFTVVDSRTHASIRSTIPQLASDIHVIVKTRMHKSGNVTEAKIKITG